MVLAALLSLKIYTYNTLNLLPDEKQQIESLIEIVSWLQDFLDNRKAANQYNVLSGES